jgi:hypothetical protein
MNSPDDPPDDPTLAALREETLRHFGRRLFEEARQQSALDDAEFETWRRERKRARADEGVGSFSSTGEWGPPDGGDGGE